MSNNYESQSDDAAGAAQRGPSFEDPTHVPSPVPHSPLSGQDWDSAWGGTDDAQQATDTQQGAGYGAASQPSSYGGGAPDPRSGQPYAQQNPYAERYPGQNPYGEQYPGQNPYANQGSGYQPYGVYGGYGYGQPVKSKTTAALLAFFLGWLGIHNFYLGKKNLGLIHVGIVVGAIVVMIVGAVLAATSGDTDSPYYGLIVLMYFVLMGNNLWAFVEFIIILVKPEHELGH